jgi:hypothetical protein
VRFGDRRQGTLIDVPKVFGGSILVHGAREQIVERSGAREVWLYPRGGRYVLRVRSARGL